ncbi:MAG: methylenetetrahydrofolate reductase [Acidimicrobiia bacterium]
MKIADILARGRTYSFEFFPPKTPDAQAQLEATLRDLEPLGPSFVSVTYGAGGSTRERTREVIVGLLRDASMVPMAHLTCAAHTRAELVDIVTRYRDEGLQNILALRGDPPADLDLPPGELAHATDLVALVREVGDFSVGVAVHPEGHPASTDRATDLQFQAAKLRAADFGVTQFFFRIDDYTRFVDEMRARDVDTPIVPGIMPVLNLGAVQRMAAMSGAAFPAELEAELLDAEGRGGAEEVRQLGIAKATELCSALLDAGAPGLHFYTLNRSPATREIFTALGLTPA